VSRPAAAGPDLSAVSDKSGGARLAVAQRGPWLTVDLATPHAILSWAVVGGGAAVGRAVVWHQVTDAELGPEVDPVDLLRQRLAAIGRSDAVGLLTGARLDRHVDVERQEGGRTARCVATVGLGNALRIGDPPGAEVAAAAVHAVGTINLLLHVDTPLSLPAQLELLSLATEARTAAVLAGAVRSRRSGLIATGTGTDCIAIASPLPDGGPDSGAPAMWAGKHTLLGHLAGAAVHEAIRQAVERWTAEHGA
jgi:adenosylcobinamide amidohydrolase